MSLYLAVRHEQVGTCGFFHILHILRTWAEFTLRRFYTVESG